jgi:hypothetical protein
MRTFNVGRPDLQVPEGEWGQIKTGNEKRVWFKSAKRLIAKKVMPRSFEDIARVYANNPVAVNFTTGLSWLGIDALAKLSGLPRATVYRLRERAVEKGLFELVRKGTQGSGHSMMLRLSIPQPVTRKVSLGKSHFETESLLLSPLIQDSLRESVALSHIEVVASLDTDNEMSAPYGALASGEASTLLIESTIDRPIAGHLMLGQNRPNDVTRADPKTPAVIALDAGDLPVSAAALSSPKLCVINDEVRAAFGEVCRVWPQGAADPVTALPLFAEWATYVPATEIIAWATTIGRLFGGISQHAPDLSESLKSQLAGAVGRTTRARMREAER